MAHPQAPPCSPRNPDVNTAFIGTRKGSMFHQESLAPAALKQLETLVILISATLSLKQPRHLKFLETLKRGIYEAEINETCWQGELETYESSSLIPSNQVNTTQHKNNVRQLSDCLKFSFDIWRKNMINSELELTYEKLFHPLHLGTHHNPNLSKQKIKFSFWTTLMQAQETQTGSSLWFFSRAWAEQAAAAGTCIHASSLRRISMT